MRTTKKSGQIIKQKFVSTHYNKQRYKKMIKLILLSHAWRRRKKIPEISGLLSGIPKTVAASISKRKYFPLKEMRQGKARG